MGVLKSVLKMVLGLAIGIVAGFLIAGIIIVGFTDTSMSEFIDKLKSVSFSESVIAAVVGAVAFILSGIVLVIVHETGHFVCGIMSGYSFVSFRIFNFTIIKIDGRLRVKRFSIDGTGGQCLLTPPDLPLEKIPVEWYNFGGVFFNIIAMLAVAPLLLVKGHPFVTECVVIFMLAAFLLILLNGIPMKLGGVGNDGYNMIVMRKNMIARRGLVVSLRANVLIQEGVRPKDMPDALFVISEKIDYRNPLEVTLPMMVASRLVDEMRYAEALTEYEGLYGHRDEIIPLYVKEIACELVFLRLMNDDMAGAAALLDDKLRKYIEAYRKVMSSKERILCAVALKLDNDREKALSIYENLKSRENDYLLQGEVKSDLAIMRDMLGL